MAKSKQFKMTTSDVSDLCFPVRKIKTRMAANDDCEYDIVVYPSEYPNGRRVASCAARYELIENSQVFEYFEQLLKNLKIKYEVSYEMVNYAIFTAKFNLLSKGKESLAYQVTPKDKIYPMIKIRHSYNSQAKYAFMFGYFRLVCSNGLVIPVEEMKEYNLEVTGKHTKFFHENFALLEDKLMLFKEKSSGEFLDRIKKMVKKRIPKKTLSTRVEEVFKATGIAADGLGATKKPEKKGENIRAVISIAEYESSKLDMPICDWLLYNAINQFLFNDKRNAKSDEVRTATDHKVMKYLLETA